MSGCDANNCVFAAKLSPVSVCAQPLFFFAVSPTYRSLEIYNGVTAPTGAFLPLLILKSQNSTQRIIPFHY